MNCKPQELCRVVGMTTTPEANDWFVVTDRLFAVGERTAEGYGYETLNVGPVWLVKGRQIPWRLSSGRLVIVTERPISDRCLRPIRDPGDDAQDESKAWLPPVPSTTKEHA